MSVALSLFAGAGWQFFTDSGTPLSGGKLYTYLAGTTTPETTYTDSSAESDNPNPIILNAAGRVPGEIWVNIGVSYKFVVKDAQDVLIATYDNIIGSSTAAEILFTQFGTGAVTRTVQSKLQEYVSITDFGASESEPDNAIYIQRALDAVSTAGGGEVFIPAGTWNTGAITLRDKVSIRGVGNASRLVGIDGSYDFLSYNNGGSPQSITNVKISDFYLDCTLQTGGAGMYITGLVDSEISGVTVYNAAGFGWLIFGSIRCHYLRNTINTTRQWDGMTISTGSSDNVIEGNTVINSYDSGIGFTDTISTVCVGNFVSRQKIDGNWFAPGIDAAGAKNATITGNYLLGNQYGVSLLQHPNTGKQPKRVVVTGNTIADGQYGVISGPVAVIPPAVSEVTTRDGIVISGNTIFSQDVQGIALVGAECLGVTISGNQISYCSTGIGLNGTVSPTLFSNLLFANDNGINTFATSNTSLNMAFNVFQDNLTNWVGSAGIGTTYILHNKGLDYPAGTLDHEEFASNWDFGGKLRLGGYYFWVDSSGRLRIKSGAPTSDTDGVVVGTQT